MTAKRLPANPAILGALAAIAIAVLGLQLGESEPGLLYLAPALLLLLALAFDRYPGERLIQAAAHRRHRSPRAGRSRPPLLPLPLLAIPRGGALLAYGLAGRGPPALAPPPSQRGART